jgi:peptidoglycan/LPS O-acetylase OafA/YrhL
VSHPSDPYGRPARLGWHRLDVVSLVAGLLAVAVALVSLLEVDVEPGLVLPAVLIAVGAIGLVAALRRGQEDDEP